LRRNNADARSSSAVVVSIKIHIAGERSRRSVEPYFKTSAVSVRVPQNTCGLHLSRSGAVSRSMQKTAIVFPECFAASLPATSGGCGNFAPPSGQSNGADEAVAVIESNPRALPLCKRPARSPEGWKFFEEVERRTRRRLI
jgi:hypothetical protein